MPGMISGRVTRRKVVKALAPRSFAASSRLRSKPISRERTTTTTKLMQNITCAISSVWKPSDGVPRMRKKESSAAPMTTSGVAIGITIRKFAERRPKNWWRTSASAIIVPTMVEITVASTASLRLVSERFVEFRAAEGVRPVFEGEADPGVVVAALRDR